VIEIEKFLGVGAMEVEHGCRVSDLARTLLDAGRRPDLIGGVDIIGDALKLADIDNVAQLVDYANELDGEAALRRLGSIADAIGQSATAEQIRNRLSLPNSPIPVDTSADSSVKVWVDPEWNVAWDATSVDLLGLPVRV
jgi:predicted transcriptional regulator of viral defense system